MGQASEWRFDPLTGRRVLISPDRGDRPLHPTAFCPFCEGHESETPPEVLAYREPGSAPNGPGWRVRVVPNRYAAVRMDPSSSPLSDSERGARGVRSGPERDDVLSSSPLSASERGAGGVRSSAERNNDPSSSPLSASERGAGGVRSSGLGVAEVFLEGPHHETKFRNLPPEIARDVLRAWRDRLRFWRDDGRIAFAQVFKNEGEAAGASVDHCHSQLIALPFVPPRIADELNLASDAAGCPFCSWIASERAGPTFVFESDRFAVFCPSAPRFPGETWILPKAHGAAFETLTDADATELSNVLRNLLVRIADALAGPDFNLIVKSAPFRHDGPFHWRIEILPRLTSTAGWEWGTGLLINTMFPERAAELLRAARPAAT